MVMVVTVVGVSSGDDNQWYYADCDIYWDKWRPVEWGEAGKHMV